ncbi:sodium:solute symporter [Pseudoxanthomonas wuyuanensis]|nr:sodium:solute symporter [Pseudoxanthomonas wuyuanensis]
MTIPPQAIMRKPASIALHLSRCLWVLLLLLCAAIPAAYAESLVSVKHTGFPPLASDAPLIGLAAIDARPVAVTADGAWLLAEDQHSWRRAAWPSQPSDAKMVGLVGTGRDAWLLRQASDGRLQRIERLSLGSDQLQAAAMAPLPEMLSDARLAAQGDTLYLAGLGKDGAPQLYRASISRPDAAWQTLLAWPGDGVPVALVAQTSALYLTATATDAAQQQLWRWSAESGWEQAAATPGNIIAGSGRAIGQAHILYLMEALPGAAARLMSFHTITGAWAALPDPHAGNAGHVTAWQDGLLWAKPGQAPGRIGFDAVQIDGGRHLLKWLDWIVIVLYLAVMVGIGGYFYLAEKRTSTSDFFVGGRSIPFWAAGVSLYATNTSSISFIAIPAKAFESNWQYLANNLIAVLGLMFVAVWIVPLLRRLDLMSVFTYLETRFHPAIRMLASALCILMQIGSRMSVILFLPALAIATITGIDVVWSILIMGVFTILYTTLGGMKAVIWTDFVQVFVMFGGAIFAIGFIVYQLNGGVPEFVGTAMAADKMKVFDFSFDLTKATVWGFIFLVVFDVVLTFPKDQVLMQRVLSTRSDREAGRSIWTFAAIMIPGGFLFYLIGTALYVYYQSHPERMNPMLPIDATFPLFIAAELPMGVTGLIVAGILAAAMSTLSSIINSVSTLVSVDFYERLVKNPTPKKSVLFAEITGVLVGLTGIGIALLLSRHDIHSLFDVSIELAGLLGGGFAGAYTLGMFTRRANAKGVAIGIGSSIALTLLAWSMDLVHPYFYLAISILLCIVIGYAASLLFPAPRQSLEGLTIYRQRPGRA